MFKKKPENQKKKQKKYKKAANFFKKAIIQGTKKPPQISILIANDTTYIYIYIYNNYIITHLGDPSHPATATCHCHATGAGTQGSQKSKKTQPVGGQIPEGFYR
jgi:hypothetical protein